MLVRVSVIFRASLKPMLRPPVFDPAGLFHGFSCAAAARQRDARVRNDQKVQKCEVFSSQSADRHRRASFSFLLAQLLVLGLFELSQSANALFVPRASGADLQAGRFLIGAGFRVNTSAAFPDTFR
jgi:hypothetical protein